jgi:hypothetical protein
MPSSLQDFIKNQLKSPSPGPGRFFTAFNGDFVVGDSDLLSQYDEILKSIGEGQPDPAMVTALIKKVDQSLNSIFTELESEDSTLNISEEQKNDIKYSLFFKFPGFLLKSKGVQELQPYQALSQQSPVLTHVAQKYFVRKEKDVAENIVSFYQAEYQKVLGYFSGNIAQIDPVASEKDFFKAMKFDANTKFKFLPQTYKEELSTALWKEYLALKAKENPYPLSLANLDEMVVNTIRKASLTTVESMAQTMTERSSFTEREIEWMKNTPISKVTMGDNYADKDNSSMEFFNLSGDSEDGSGIKISARGSTHNEFRGVVLRNMILNAQALGKEQSVYEAFQEHIRVLKNNNDWEYLQTAVMSSLLAGNGTPNGIGYAQDFDPGTPVYEAVKTQIIQGLQKFGEKYGDVLTASSDLLDPNGKLTAKGKKYCAEIVNEINVLNPFPPDLIKFLKSYESFEQQMQTMLKQLNQGQPFEVGSKQHLALKSLYDSLNAARLNLTGNVATVSSPEGMRKYNIDDFHQDCDRAFKVAENSALKNETGWWARFFKPLLTCIGVLCSAFSALAFPSVRNAILNESNETPGMQKTRELKNALKDMKANYIIEKNKTESEAVKPENDREPQENSRANFP